MVLDMPPATLIGGEGRGLGRLAGQQRLGDLQHQALQQRGADAAVKRVFFRPLWISSSNMPSISLAANTRPTLPAASPWFRSKLPARRPVKSTKYFTRGSAALGGDFVRHARGHR